MYSGCATAQHNAPNILCCHKTCNTGEEVEHKDIQIYKHHIVCNNYTHTLKQNLNSHSHIVTKI
jgi:hypothetical protein